MNVEEEFINSAWHYYGEMHLDDPEDMVDMFLACPALFDYVKRKVLKLRRSKKCESG